MTDQAVETPIATETATNETSAVSNDSKNMAVLVHVLAIFFGFIPSLVFYLVKTDDAFIREHAKENLNASISFIIYYFVAALLAIIMIGLLIMPVLGICWLVFNIIAAVKASKADYYRFPLIIRLIK